MGRGLLVAALGAALLLPSSAAAGRGNAAQARAGIKAAVAKGWLTPVEAERYRAIVLRADVLDDRLPADRSRVLGTVLAQVADQSGRYTRPRALTLFSMLNVNSLYLANHPVPPARRDVEGPDGVVYRSFGGRGLQFHPLANGARLNAHVSARRHVRAGQLANALLDRGVSRWGGTTWEYWFDFGGTPAPWTSGMAQSVMAQSLARAGEALGDTRLLAAARRAYVTVPPLTMQLSAGPWVHLYEGQSLIVLNAQLQAAVSVGEYARISADENAAAFGARLRASAKALLPSFDTGYWTNYSLRGRESPLDYQRYVVRLLWRLAQDTGEPKWKETAARIGEYEHQPPLLRDGPPTPTLYPAPRDGHRDEAVISFWVSKISDVTLVVGGEQRRTVRVRSGWNTIWWPVPTRMRPGSYRTWLVGRDLVGNRGQVELADIVVARDTRAPLVRARVSGGRLHWRATEAGSDRLFLRVVLRRGDGRVVRLDLGRHPLSGVVRVRIPRGRWDAMLAAYDASGNRARVQLGTVRGRG